MGSIWRPWGCAVLMVLWICLIAGMLLLATCGGPPADSREGTAVTDRLPGRRAPERLGL